jgi:leucyl-tRNA synthetase
LDDLLELTTQHNTIEGISDEAAADSIRFFLSYYQSLDKDFDWRDDLFVSTGVKGVSGYVNTIHRAVESLDDAVNQPLTDTDKWFSSFEQQSIQDITAYMDQRDTRKAMIELVDIRNKGLSQYLQTEKQNTHLLTRFAKNQISMGFPVMPRVTQELQKMYFPEDIINWPSADKKNIYPEEYVQEEHQQNGKRFVGELIGKVQSTIGPMLGRKELTAGDKIILETPTVYEANILQENINKLPSHIDIDIKSNSKKDVLEVIKQE